MCCASVRILLLQPFLNYVTTFQNKIDLMMKRIAELSQKPSQPLNCSPQITTLTPPDSTPESCVTPPPFPPTSSTSLSIVAWNCRGLSTGLPYLEYLADQHDILIVSEHWLWPFELHEFSTLHPDYSGFAVADNRLTPTSNLQGGCGGIGIAWRKCFKVSLVTGIDSDRVCAITVESSPAPTMIIGVYLPTTDQPIEDFRHHLCVIVELANRHLYGPVCIAGDFNAHVGRNGGPRGRGNSNPQGRLLSEFVYNNDLFFTSLGIVATGPLYTYFCETSQTTTDYAIVDAVHAPLVSTCTTLDNHPLNSSDHLPISLTLSLPSSSNALPSVASRLNWKVAVNEGLIHSYASTVGLIIGPLLGRKYGSMPELAKEIQYVTKQILQAASTSIPRVNHRPRKKRFSNNPELKALSIKCKAAWKKWRDAGRPVSGSLFDEKRTLKKLTRKCADKCRAIHERHSWEKREKLFREKDPRRFKTPSNQPTLGDRLLLNGEITSDPHLVQTCWISHFRSLLESQATSNPNVEKTCEEINNLASLSTLNNDDIVDDEFSVEEIELALKRLKCGKAGGIDGLQPEHLKYGGSSLALWLKQVFCTFSHFECVPEGLLTGIIKPIYKGKGKDPLTCNSYRGITMMSVIMKTFEYTLLERILPVLEENGHPALTQTAYQKHISCQDAIFATHEAIRKTIQDGHDAFLSLYDLEKAYDSIEHSVLLQALYNAGVNGKSWRLIRSCYGNLHACVKSGSTLSPAFSVSRGVQQGSVLSPTFFLIVMDKLLNRLRDEQAGVSIEGLFLGGAAHADDVRTIASSLASAEAQGALILEFATQNGLSLNQSKTEIVKVSKSQNPGHAQLHILDSVVDTIPHAKCLGFHWSHSLSARHGVEENIAKARRQFFALGASGCFLGHSNPLTSSAMVETCVMPTLLYGAENWSLDLPTLDLLERFQAEIGRRILKLSRYHSKLRSHRTSMALDESQSTEM